MSNSLLLKRCGVLLAAACVTTAAMAAPPATMPTTQPMAGALDGRVSPADQVQFEQKTVEAQMKELQERMYRLADLTREAEPDDSSRLLMAVRKAREDLILEQMKDTVEQLGRADLTRASDEQQQIIAKLLELKKLLMTTDLDMQMQLDKLRKMAVALKSLDGAIKEERREQKQSGDQAKAKTDLKKLEAGKTEQQQNRRATETLAQAMKDLGGQTAKAADTLGTASQGMSVAEGHLGGGRPGDAAPSQARAGDDLQKARDQIAAEQQKIMEELQASVRKQVVAALQEMLDRQVTIRNGTEAAVNRGGTGDRQVNVRVKQLAPGETSIVRIADETLELIDTTQFSVALPPALSDIRRQCASIAERLDAGAADKPLVAEQVQVEQDLKDLIETFKQLASQPGNGQCRCKGNKNKLLAEMKVLRLMQTRVDAETARADAVRAAGGDASHETTVVHDNQEKIQLAVDHIHEDLTGK